ncbi:MAG: hypothetical protein AAF747_04860 [Planctomycetota bacterium]
MPPRRKPNSITRLAVLAATLVVASPGAGQNNDTPAAPTERREASLVLADGRQLVGTLVLTDEDGVVIEISGIETRYTHDQVREVIVLPPIRERYRRHRELIADDDIDQLLTLVEWAKSRELFGLALIELQGIRARDADNVRAKELVREIEALMKLRDLRVAGSDDPNTDTERGPRPEITPLSPDQINLLKVYELDLTDPPPLRVTRDTIDRFIEQYGDHELMPQSDEGRAAMRRWRPERILDRMFRVRARDLYGEVTVDGEPEAFKRFREDVHAEWLSRSCATNACHGGAEAGRFWLKSDRRNSEPTVYTNFLILERFRLDDGQPLIDYTNPSESPLLQLALDPRRSSRPHPEVAIGNTRFRPAIDSRDDARFRRAVEWINSMYRPRPEYPVTFTPPVPPGEEGRLIIDDGPVER